MDKYIQLLSLLLQEAKDPSALLKRVLTALAAILIYFLVANPSQIVSVLKIFSTSAVLEDLKEQRINNFPAVAREKAMILFSQTRADAVFVVKYKPDAVNDYQNIVAWEGVIPLTEGDQADKAVDKTSNLYRRHLEGFNYVVRVDDKNKLKYSGLDIPTFKNFQFDFIYTCPFFNLNNSYAGYIGIAWKEPPVTKEDEAQLSEYLAKLCDPQRRALGRSI